MSTRSKRKSMENKEEERVIRKQSIREENNEVDHGLLAKQTNDENDLEKTEKEKYTRITVQEEHIVHDNTSNNNHKKAKTVKTTHTDTTTDSSNSNDAIELEDFEVGASPFVTLTEATQQYCLPAGTLSVCTVVEERPNPRNPRWAKVKLYARSEIRQRAHKRYGGREGLRAEREKRAQQRYEKDARRMKDLFR